jgi:DNA-directed RNA polymerase subunit RPC12/RpoP
MGKPYNELNLNEARHIAENYLCSHCWGHLEVQPVEEGFYQAICPNCGGGKGFHSKSYVQRKRDNDKGDYMDAKHNLAGILGLERKPLNEKEIEETINNLYP